MPFLFFFQAEDGIRDPLVTGVQTCALPISGSLAEALDLLAGDGDDLTVLAGGMSLLPMMNLGIVRPTKVLSLNRVPELTQVIERDGEIVIGAMVRHHRVAGDPLIQRHAPLLAAAARVVGDVQVRNR